MPGGAHMYDYDGRGRKALHRFRFDTANALQCQRELLKEIIYAGKDTAFGKKYNFANICSIKEYQDRVPVTVYEDYRTYIEREIPTGNKCAYYSVSSGNTGEAKLIPVSRKATEIYETFACDAVCGMINEYYAGMIPEKIHSKIFHTGEFRKNEVHGLPAGIRSSAVYQAMLERGEFPFDNYTSPKEVLFPDDRQDLMYAKARFALADRNVTCIHSVFVHRIVNVFEYIEKNWDTLLYDIGHGTISKELLPDEKWRRRLAPLLKPLPERAAELRAIDKAGLSTDMFKKIWKNLLYVIVIGGSSFYQYNEKFYRYLGDVPVHYFVYASSEGLLGIANGLNRVDEYILVPEACFFEFIPLDEDEKRKSPVKDISTVICGRRYEIVITNLSGFYRYLLGDVIEIAGFYGQSPLVRFCYRNNQFINLAGEKTNTEQMDNAVHEFSEKNGLGFVQWCMYGEIADGSGRYIFLYEAENEGDGAVSFDECMKNCNLDYMDCRSNGELIKAVSCRTRPGSFAEYGKYMESKGAETGQAKPVKLLDGREKIDFFNKYIESVDKI